MSLNTWWNRWVLMSSSAIASRELAGDGQRVFSQELDIVEPFQDDP